jgi:hypothetical protein
VIGDHDEPLHVAKSGDRFDAQRVLAGSKDANRCIGYLTKYLTKHVGDCHQASTQDQAAHAGRLAEALRDEPCSPTCANWLRYGVQPKNPRPGLRPGCCKGKAHRREHLDYAGRRVLVSRKWSGRTLADHRADRKAWLTGMLGLPATDPTRYTREPVKPGDPELHFHDLRHTGNTMAAAQGASLRELMERMGHSSTRAALIYLHATRERDEAIARGMGQLLTDARKTNKRPDRSGTQRARGRNRAS